MNEKNIPPGAQRPDLNTVPEFYRGYVDKAESDSLFDAMEIALDRTMKLVKTLPENGGLLKYADDKWTINEVLQHIIDSERIFAYRALRFARADATELPGFDHDAYVPASKSNRRRTDLLLKELIAVRMSSIALFVSFTEEMLVARGVANGQTIDVRTIGWVIAGHNTHHLRVIQERYLA
jgi:hypothetical protein